jgi:phage-related protein (TIGR01555 family)
MIKKIKDSYVNLAKKIGTKDGFFKETWSFSEFDEIGLMQNIVEMPVKDSLLTGIKTESKECLAEFERLKPFLSDCVIKLRREGIILIVPKMEKNITKDYYSYSMLDMNPLSDSFLEFEVIDILNANSVQLFREKDFTIFTLPATENYRLMNGGAGVSVIERISLEVKQYIESLLISTNVLGQLNQDVYKFNGLTETIMEDGGEEAIEKRLDFINHYKSNHSTLMIDGEDEYISVNKTLSGADKIIYLNAVNVCAVAKIPYSRLFGKGSTGLNNSGEHELKLYYDTVVSDIRNNYLEKIFDIVTENKFKDKWEWLPLYTENPKEESETLQNNVSSIEKLLELDIVNEEEAKKMIGIQ